MEEKQEQAPAPQEPAEFSTERTPLLQDNSTYNGFRRTNTMYGDMEFDDAINRAKDAISHGVQPSRITQGSSGSYFVRGTHGEILGVYKPKDEEPYGHLNPKWTKWLHKTCCPFCFGRSCLIPNQGYLSEAGASIVDQKLNLSLVPRTRVIKLASPSFNYERPVRWYYHLQHKPLPHKTGSFQLFVRGYKDGTQVLHKFDDPTRPDLRSAFGFEFEKLVVLDYVIRNTDRGNDNWLVKIEDPQDPDQCDVNDLRVRIAAIDNGLAFPFKHPDSWRTYPYYWAWLPQAKIPFSDQIRDHLLPVLISEPFVEEMIAELHEVFSHDPGFSKRMFARQASVIRGQVFNLIQALKDRLSPWELVHMPVCTISKDGNRRYQEFEEKQPCFTWC